MKILDIVNSPWAIRQGSLAEIQQIYAAHLGGEKIDWAGIQASIEEHTPMNSGLTVNEGVATIYIEGPITRGSTFLSFLIGGADIDHVTEQFDAAVADDEIEAIVLRIDSPGGTVSGISELANKIYAAREIKPIIAVSDGSIASAAYWLGAAADRLYITSKTVIAGSIGVILTHTDYSEQNKQVGEAITYIHAGKYKTVGAPDKPLSGDDKEYLQAQVDYLYSIFVDDIAKFRGVSADVVTSDMADARVFTGEQAVDAGLVDGIATMDQVKVAIGDMVMDLIANKIRRT